MKMIEFKKGNIFDSKMEYITIPVNCGGVAGAGLAEQCKKLYPKAMGMYKALCQTKVLTPGRPYSVSFEGEYRKFLFFPTKDFWYNDSKIEYIKMGLEYYVSSKENLPSDVILIDSIAFPALGCGFGMLKWEDVKPIMIEHLSKLDIPVEIYEPCPEREQNDRKYLKKIATEG